MCLEQSSKSRPCRETEARPSRYSWKFNSLVGSDDVREHFDDVNGINGYVGVCRNTLRHIWHWIAKCDFGTFARWSYFCMSWTNTCIGSKWQYFQSVRNEFDTTFTSKKKAEKGILIKFGILEVVICTLELYKERFVFVRYLYWIERSFEPNRLIYQF